MDPARKEEVPGKREVIESGSPIDEAIEEFAALKSAPSEGKRSRFYPNINKRALKRNFGIILAASSALAYVAWKTSPNSPVTKIAIPTNSSQPLPIQTPALQPESSNLQEPVPIEGRRLTEEEVLEDSQSYGETVENN